MTTYLFPGQGSQFKGMGGNLFDEFQELTEVADELLGYSIKSLCLDDNNQQLSQTQYTQPALYVVNALSYLQKIKQTKKTPDYLAGHSLGEYNALQASGAVSFADGLKIVKKRGELMSKAADGAMAAILGITKSEVSCRLEENNLGMIDIANHNSPSQIVISGLQADLEKAQSIFEKDDARFIPLNTSGAFHSRYMLSAKTKFKDYLEAFVFSRLKIPVISNVYAKPYQHEQIAQNLADQITSQVRWVQSMQYLLEQGETHFEELGVGDVLKKLISTIQEDFSTHTQSQPIINQDRLKIEQVTQHTVSHTNTKTDSSKNNEKATQGNEIDSLQQQIADWNDCYPIGTKVHVDGYEEKLETRTQAMILFGHKMAIYIQGYNGYFALDDVIPVGEYV